MPAENPPAELAHVALVREQRSRVRDLTGFRRTHQVPTEVNEHTQSFVARIAVPDLAADLDTRFADFRRLLNFKRVDLQVSEPDGGAGLITTPWFDYQVAVALAPDDPAEVIWRRQVSAFRAPQELFASAFSAVFGNLFDTVELEPPCSIDIAEFIDRIEAQAPPSISLDYDRHATWCHVSLPGVLGQLRLTADRVSLVVAQPPPPARLLEAFLKMRSQFAGIECF